MSKQDDFFEHSINTRIHELRRQIDDRETEARELKKQLRDVTYQLRGFPLSQDNRVRLVVGPERRIYVAIMEESETKAFCPISLDLLVRAVQELGQPTARAFGVNPFEN